MRIFPPNHGSSAATAPEMRIRWYARPRQRISAFITSYTGISNDHVRNAPRPEEVLCGFASWAGDATLLPRA